MEAAGSKAVDEKTLEDLVELESVQVGMEKRSEQSLVMRVK